MIDDALLETATERMNPNEDEDKANNELDEIMNKYDDAEAEAAKPKD